MSGDHKSTDSQWAGDQAVAVATAWIVMSSAVTGVGNVRARSSVAAVATPARTRPAKRRSVTETLMPASLRPIC